MTTKPATKPATKRPRKPCPNPPKGSRCPLCGGEFVCLQSWRKKATKEQT